MKELSGNCNLIIAGPGAGKTAQMVEFVEKSIQDLNHNRYLAIITYTNEATREIKTRLQQVMRIPFNVFIGTIHSFLIQFVFEPYSHIFLETTIDKIYVDEVKLNSSYESWRKEKNIPKINLLNKECNKLLKKGIITYDKILEQSCILIENEKIRYVVANRLQYIFIDEYQDARLLQHKIFMEILKENKTKFYAIGDPIQYIFHFTYGKSQIRNEPSPENYSQLPIMKLKEICENSAETCFKVKNENFRCSRNIVDFINKFNFNIQQVAVKNESGKIKLKNDNKIPVLFINKTEIKELVEEFFRLKENYDVKNSTNSRVENLFLSRKRATFESVSNELELIEISNDHSFDKCIFENASKCILSVLGKTSKQIKDDFGIDSFLFRKFVLEILKDIKKNNYKKEDIHTVNKIIFENFHRNFGFSLNHSNLDELNVSVSNSMERLILGDNFTSLSYKGHYSTIHSAKGLEASSVLVIAETKNLLEKWLETNESKLKKHDDDELRLGFVAYSRAIDFLCIGCLDSVLPDFENKLNSLNIEIPSWKYKSGKQVDLSYFFANTP